MLRKNYFKVLFSTPHFLFENSTLVVKDDEVFIEQKMYSDYEETRSKYGEPY